MEKLIEQLLAQIRVDQGRIEKIDRYLLGDHDDPYMPPTADAEYRLLAKRAISNWMPLVVSTPAQALYVDGFRVAGRRSGGVGQQAPEWEHWERSRLDGRQSSLFRGALGFGHAFTVTEKGWDGSPEITRALSIKKTAALFEDVANDIAPVSCLTIVREPYSLGGSEVPGEATLWHEDTEFSIVIQNGKYRIVGERDVPSRPITRFAPYVDLEGRTRGLVEPLIPIQDRINQTTFDLLVAQTYGSFKVRYVTGMAPPLKKTPVRENPSDPNSPIISWDPLLDENGVPVPDSVRVNQSRFMFAQSPDARFGSLDETPLEGYIAACELAMRQLSALGQIPPHFMLGQIANLSAEALQAAKASADQLTEEVKHSFGESLEHCFSVASELRGDEGERLDGQVIWRDMEIGSLAQSADALGKLAENLQIPPQGLWPRVPNVTTTELSSWQRMYEDSDYQGQLAKAQTAAMAKLTPKAA